MIQEYLIFINNENSNHDLAPTFSYGFSFMLPAVPYPPDIRSIN